MHRRRDVRANHHLRSPRVFTVLSPHDGQAAQIKGLLIMPSGWTAARQPEVQSKVDVLGGPPPPVTAAEAAVQAEHRLNLANSSGIWLRESIAGF